MGEHENLARTPRTPFRSASIIPTLAGSLQLGDARCNRLVDGSPDPDVQGWGQGAVNRLIAFRRAEKAPWPGTLEVQAGDFSHQ